MGAPPRRSSMGHLKMWSGITPSGTKVLPAGRLPVPGRREGAAPRSRREGLPEHRWVGRCDGRSKGPWKAPGSNRTPPSGRSQPEPPLGANIPLRGCRAKPHQGQNRLAASIAYMADDEPTSRNGSDQVSASSLRVVRRLWQTFARRALIMRNEMLQMTTQPQLESCRLSTPVLVMDNAVPTNAT